MPGRPIIADGDFVSVFVRRRNDLRLSQADVADRIGCHEKLISKWETKLVAPTTKLFIAWAEALGYEVCIHAKS